ncbi:pentapeptide repeat-containing protein [Actinokineospora cianjurensis]|uniref:Pentapeptide repeat protein n=1 Tax=Actinokineospora cianjurensis TaxID=585224 RepID=A0A421B3X3_9PSEU|nr:pentapeptide repeat-containing protein [Actinokineospora cianjurensis]RLK58990.1 pentapeptide repeat protein [Actinokineospora cianjurensis]
MRSDDEADDGGRDEPEDYTVLSVRVMLVWAVVIVAVGVGVAVWLLAGEPGRDSEENRVRLDAIRTAGSIVVGTGGAAALLLAARRQRSTEIGLRQKDRDQAAAMVAFRLQERVAADTRDDAAARRITDLYTKAVELLGSAQAPARLGGLYALERLAQDNPGQRQTIVNVLCACLRMPCDLPDEASDDLPVEVAEEALAATYRDRLREREVRLTAQRLIAAHLHPGTHPGAPVPTYWHDIDLDLTAATLVGFSLHGCAARTVVFKAATFVGYADFGSATVSGDADFGGTTFTSGANFGSVVLRGDTDFEWATFSDHASFEAAVFAGADFEWSTFTDGADFASARFTRGANFGSATFSDGADFERARFDGEVTFGSATFGGYADFRGALFLAGMDFGAAAFGGDTDFHGTGLTAGDEPGFRGATFDRGAPPELTGVRGPLE